MIRSSLFVFGAVLLAGCGSNSGSSNGGSPGGSGGMTQKPSMMGPMTTTVPDDGGSTQPGLGEDGGTLPVQNQSDGGTEEDAGMTSTVGYPATHPDPPQVVSGGGAELATPKIVTVTYTGDTFQSQLEDFGNTFTATPFWTAVTKEYGVNSGSGGTPVHITTAAPTSIDDTQVQTWILQELSDSTFPAPDANTVYVIYYPSQTTITLQGQQSCQVFGGYHSSVQASDGSQVSYAVIPRCGSFNGLSGIDVLTAAASHEIIEASTDAAPLDQNAPPGYAQTDDDHIPWMIVLGGGEVADMCAQFPGVEVKPSGYDYTVQRSWSNLAAMASHDPCVPAPTGEVYFNSAVEAPDTLNLTIEGQKITTKGIHVPVNSSAMVNVDLFSDAPTSGDWDVSVADLATLEGGTAELNLSLDKSSGHNGDVLHLTVNAIKKDTTNGFASFIVESKLGSQVNLWIGVVGN